LCLDEDSDARIESLVVSKKIRVLVAEVSPGEAAIALRATYGETDGPMELTDVASVTTLLSTVSMVDPDVILLDLALAGPDAVDTVRRVHR
jgi:CheY-like chemotaxis protein